LLACPAERRSLDFLQRHIAHLGELQKTHHWQHFPRKIPQRFPAGALLLQVAEE
jgi:hypothetical protein